MRIAAINRGPLKCDHSNERALNLSRVRLKAIDAGEMRDPKMTETGHEDRTLLDVLSLQMDEDDNGDLAELDPSRPTEALMRIDAHGMIIGHLLAQVADLEAAESAGIRPGLSRHYFEV